MHTDFSHEQKDLLGIIVFMAFITEKSETTVFTYCWMWILVPNHFDRDACLIFVFHCFYVLL